MARTTFELTAPLRFPLGRKSRIGDKDAAVVRTHKPMPIAIDTLRL